MLGRGACPKQNSPPCVPLSVLFTLLHFCQCRGARPLCVRAGAGCLPKVSRDSVVMMLVMHALA
eukprot:6356888-Karenia_brevis.AAC.1